MNNVKFINRIFAQVINYLIYYLIGFAAVSALYILQLIDLPTYLFLSVLAGFLVHLLLGTMITYLSKRLSIGGAIFQIKVVAAEERKAKLTQIIIRTLYEAILVFLLLDYLFLLLKKTSRSAIDRASSTFLITILD